MVPTASSTVAGKVQLATINQTLDGSNNILAITPWTLRNALNQALTSDITATVVSNGGSSSYNIYDSFSVNSSATLANSITTRHASTHANSFLTSAISGQPPYRINFAKPMAVKWVIRPIISTGSRIPLENDGWFGGFIAQSRTFADIPDGIVTTIGFGFKIDSSYNVIVSCRNASGVFTDTFASGLDLTPGSTTALPAEIYQYSDGNGNLYTYLNGNLVSTITNGPTTVSNVSASWFALWGVHLFNGTVTPTNSTVFVSSIPKIYFNV